MKSLEEIKSLPTVCSLNFEALFYLGIIQLENSTLKRKFYGIFMFIFSMLLIPLSALIETLSGEDFMDIVTRSNVSTATFSSMVKAIVFLIRVKKILKIVEKFREVEMWQNQENFKATDELARRVSLAVPGFLVIIIIFYAFLPMLFGTRNHLPIDIQIEFQNFPLFFFFVFIQFIQMIFHVLIAGFIETLPVVLMITLEGHCKSLASKIQSIDEDGDETIKDCLKYHLKLIE